MKVVAMFSIVPVGTGVSLSPYIAACERILADTALETELHAHGTNVEGEWDEVFGALRRCVEAVHELGAPRVATFVKLGTRTDREPSMRAMVDSVRDKL